MSGTHNIVIQNKLTCGLKVRRSEGGATGAMIGAGLSQSYTVPGDFGITDTVLLEAEVAFPDDLKPLSTQVQQGGGDLVVVLQDIFKSPRRWEMTFMEYTKRRLGSGDLAQAVAAPATNNTTVTVGEDEPKWMLTLAATSAAAGALAALHLFGKFDSPALLIGAIGLSVVTSLSLYFKYTGKSGSKK